MSISRSSKNRRQSTSWMWVPAILASVLFCLSGAINAGITGPYLASPWAVFLVAVAAMGKWHSRLILLILAPVCILLYYGHEFAPSMYYNAIGRAVVISQATTPDESNMLSCGVITGSRGPNDATSLKVTAGTYKTVGVAVTGGVDAPIEWHYIIAVPGTGHNLSNAANFLVDTKSNYSCVTSGPKSKRVHIVKTWVTVAGFPMYLSAWIAIIASVAGLLTIS